MKDDTPDSHSYTVDFWDMPRNLPLAGLASVIAAGGVEGRFLGMSQKSTGEPLYPAKAGITGKVNVVQRQGYFSKKSVNGRSLPTIFLRIC